MTQTSSELSSINVFITASNKFNILAETIHSALKHMKDHPNASIEEALRVGLMDWDTPMIEQYIEDYEIELPF